MLRGPGKAATWSNPGGMSPREYSLVRDDDAGGRRLLSLHRLALFFVKAKIADVAGVANAVLHSLKRVNQLCRRGVVGLF